MKNLGIFGGTFDIVHNGHIDVAKVVARTIGLDSVFFVTAARPPHKQSRVLDSEYRHELVQVALEGLPGMMASRIELDMPGLSYTYRTVRELKAMYAAQTGEDVAASFILSAEYLDPANPSNIITWEESSVLLADVQLVVVPRGIYTAESARKWADELKLPKVRILEEPVSNLSSGIVRDALREGKPIDEFVPARVAELVKLRGIVYR